MKNFYLLLFCSISFLFTAPLSAAEAIPEEAHTLLLSSDFEDKSAAIDLIVESAGDQAKIILEAMLGGDLYYVKKDDTLVFVEKQGSKYQLTSVVDNSDLGLVSKRKVKKISINNNLRGQLKLAIASLAINNPDADVRLKAVEAQMGEADEAMVQRLQSLKEKEQDARVVEAIDAVVAVARLKADDPKVQVEAIEALGSNLNPVVLGILKQLAADSESSAVKKAAATSIKKIEDKVRFYGYIETLFFGLSLGSILALAAIGLAITFGVMGVINMAHGELIMLGAYTTYLVQQAMPNAIGLSILVALPAAFIVSGLAGIAIERGVIRFLYGRPLETLLATFGVSLILQQLVRTTISAQNVIVENPGWLSGSLEFNSVLSITYNRFYIFLFCLVVFLALYLIMKKTSLGLHVRAVSQNRDMARSMGIRSQWVDAMTFGLGSGIAGVAGVALSQITNVGPNLGQAYIVDSFMVVVFGGVGNLWGTLISGLSLGVVNKYLEPVTGAVLAKILVLVFIILFIQKRPRGLFPQKGRAAEQ